MVSKDSLSRFVWLFTWLHCLLLGLFSIYTYLRWEIQALLLPLRLWPRKISTRPISHLSIVQTSYPSLVSRILTWTLNSWKRKLPFWDLDVLLDFCLDQNITYLSLFLCRINAKDFEKWILRWTPKIVYKGGTMASPTFLIGKNSNHLYVRFIHPFDGHQALEKICQTIDEPMEETISAELDWFPAPEVLVSMDRDLTLEGYPPWPIPWTEIVQVPSNGLISRAILEYSLDRYERSVANFGR